MERLLTPSYIARCAVLAMALEVSGTPKPGNIDRDHDYADTKYEDFIAAAIGVYPVMERAVRSDGIGQLILDACEESTSWQQGGNTHFGAYILLFPLIKAATSNFHDLQNTAINIVRETTVEDAVQFYRAFGKVQVKMKGSEELDVADEKSLDEIRQRELTLFGIMDMSSKKDMVAREWTNGFSRSFKAAELIYERRLTGTLNDAIVLTYLDLLADEPDTFIAKKYDLEKAVYVQGLAIDVQERRMTLTELSNRLYREKINPGSTADIIIAGIFIALLRGMKV
ncbi:triphosphoribosyl-dephospho-CoA synthase [Methanocella arvoryzae]|uniref:Predicted triphosphoribosyl-dephospho-CoA protein n=1 Tax=Methanocella arvoryzae (strain DSM 22066 / NBRC 105507 / MRE50) TaxID=351160 RepID=Q0W0I2_METAR|nr:triphosphoribosyl-dephospho-CoA synthase [Methanocella arvoryzae]CAJ38111.1 predicted triphosphoribosyl-dephospho-CoA protein [Methanocella arvoryzae MRE50]